MFSTFEFFRAPFSKAVKANTFYDIFGASTSWMCYFVVFQNLLKKQVETRTADGRRRITPLCIAQLDTG